MTVLKNIRTSIAGLQKDLEKTHHLQTDLRTVKNGNYRDICQKAITLKEILIGTNADAEFNQLSEIFLEAHKAQKYE